MTMLLLDHPGSENSHRSHEISLLRRKLVSGVPHTVESKTAKQHPSDLPQSGLEARISDVLCSRFWKSSQAMVF